MISKERADKLRAEIGRVVEKNTSPVVAGVGAIAQVLLSALEREEIVFEQNSVIGGAIADVTGQRRLAAERDELRTEVERQDAMITRVRTALTNAGIPDAEPYPTDVVDDHERSLRTGGRVLDVVERLTRLAKAHDDARAEVDRLTKEREGERAELGHVRAELRDTAAKLSALRSAPASCTPVNLLGPVTEEEHAIIQNHGDQGGWLCWHEVCSAIEEVLASRRKAGANVTEEPTVSEEELDAAWEELDAAWEELRGFESIDPDNVRAALLAAAKVRAGGGA